jgi:hypothetical protein
MAYGLRYICGYTNIHNNNGRVVIYEEDYTDDSEYLTLRFNSVKINYTWGGWENPIIGQTASFSIVNDKDDFFELLPLMTSEERKYQVIIEELDKGANKMLFKGFLDCKDMEQKYLERQDIRLNASGYLSKLQYVDAPTVEILENDTFINIILDCIEQIGGHGFSGFGIKVNCSLYAVGSSLASGQTLFNKCGIYKEVFWQNNVDRDSALEVIQKILSAFDCTMYWWDDNYWIERYADIWNESPTYVTYVSGNEYWPSDVASYQGWTKYIVDFVSLIKLDTSQIIGIMPGKKQIEMNIEQQLLFNLLVNNFEDAQLTDASAIYPPQDPPQDTDMPEIRQWLLHGGESSGGPITWSEKGLPFRNISKAVRRDGYILESDNEPHRGMYTQFRATITEDTSMTIKFKAGTATNPFTGGDIDEYTTHFPWSLMIWLPSGYFAEFIEYDMSWYVIEEQWHETKNGLEWIDIPASSWNSQLWTCDVEVTIPFHEFVESDYYYVGNNRLLLTIGTPTADQGGVEAPFPYIYIGDVTVSIDIPLEDNYIKGEVNTNFLNKLTLTQHFADWDNLAIRNGIWYGEETSADPDALDVRTETWDDAYGSSAEGLSLAEMRIKDKFRLYNVSRQKIQARIKPDEEFYRPLSLFNDSNQEDSSGDNKPQLVLVGYEYEVQSDEMDIVLSEYDNVEDINLI